MLDVTAIWIADQGRAKLDAVAGETGARAATDHLLDRCCLLLG